MSLKSVLDGHVDLGYLDRKEKNGLYLYNYSSKCMMESFWNYYTRMSRGLVIDGDSNIILRPISKFFNLNELPEVAPDKLPNDIPETSVKEDGSLLIFSWYNNDVLCVTRGAFDSEQAKVGYQILKEKYSNIPFEQYKDWTFCAELIYPENRIVLDYGGTRDIFLITAIHKEWGMDLSYKETKGLATKLGLKSVYSELRPLTDIQSEIEKGGVVNKEGYVLRYSNGLRVKVKFEEYRRLHKIITGSSVKGIWEALRAGQKTEAEFINNLPDEFKEWYSSERNKIQSQFDSLEQQTRDIFNNKPSGTRKEIALYFKDKAQHELGLLGALFAMLDGYDSKPILWKIVEPKSIKSDFRKFNREKK